MKDINLHLEARLKDELFNLSLIRRRLQVAEKTINDQALQIVELCSNVERLEAELKARRGGV